MAKQKPVPVRIGKYETAKFVQRERRLARMNTVGKVKK